MSYLWQSNSPSLAEWVYEIDNPLNRLGLEPSEYLLEVTCKRFPLRCLGNGQRSPFPIAAAYPLERKSQEPKSLPLCQIHSPAFFRVDFDPNVSKIPPQAFSSQLVAANCFSGASQLRPGDHQRSGHTLCWCTSCNE
jgi:hypothetical protein